MTLWYQCALRCGNLRTVGWIEDGAALKGKRFKVPEHGEHLWWELDKVLSKGVPASDIRVMQSRSHKGLPSASGYERRGRG
jgi:hypothetical protein